ncbi:MFS transporter [Halorussus sp. AFM4]|uniref:MFS transporter n=1 Tax=Halorussus sp. AFM4 TaxID=3421651 RepID=UPI003EB9F516
MVSAQASSNSRRGQWGCLVGIWCLSFFANAALLFPASIIPRMMTDLTVGPATVVWVVSVAYATYAASNVLVGVIIDWTSDVTVAVGATFLLVGAGIWGWTAARRGDFTSLLASRAVSGVVIGAIWTTGANLVGRTFPSDQQGISLGLFTASAPAGLAAGQFFGPVLANQWGWPADFAIFSLLNVPGLAVFLLGYRRAVFQGRSGSSPQLRELGTVLTHRSVLYGCTMGFIAYSLFLFFNSWMPTYLSNHIGLSVAKSGIFTALFPAMGLVSRAGGGIISDRLLDGRRLPVIRLSFVVSFPIVVVIGFVHIVLPLLVLLLIAGFAVQLSIGIFYSYVRDAVAENVSGTALALLTSASLTGAFLSPVIAGVLIERTDSFTTAFAYMILLSAFGLVLAWNAPESTAVGSTLRES